MNVRIGWRDIPSYACVSGITAFLQVLHPAGNREEVQADHDADTGCRGYTPQTGKIFSIQIAPRSGIAEQCVETVRVFAG